MVVLRIIAGQGLDALDQGLGGLRVGLLFGFHEQMYFLMFDSKPEWNYKFEFKKE